MNYQISGGSTLLATSLVQIFFFLAVSSENAQLTEGSDVFRTA
jgi:hypothetical protein